MKPLKILIAAALLLAATAAFARYDGGFSKERLAKLPQDKVQITRRVCAREWPDDFFMRLNCEDRRFEALETLIERSGPQE